MNAQVLDSLRESFDQPAAKTEAEWIVFEEDKLPIDNKHPIGDGPFGLVELILKDPQRLDRLIRQPQQQIALLPRFLAISLIGFTFFGVAMTLVLSATAVWPHLFPIEKLIARDAETLLQFEAQATPSFESPWLSGDAFRLIVAYAVGLIGATGICLPSLYFYSLLAGVRMTMLDVVVQSLKSKAVAAVTLIGILPIYAALGLAIAIFPVTIYVRDAVLELGLILPFIAGLAGTYSLYRGLSGLTDTMTPERQRHRQDFLHALVLSWCAVYSAVSPVLIFTLWQHFQG